MSWDDLWKDEKDITEKKPIRNREKILNILKQQEDAISISKLSELTGIDIRNLSRYWRPLEKEGKIKSETRFEGKIRYIYLKYGPVSLLDKFKRQNDKNNPLIPRFYMGKEIKSMFLELLNQVEKEIFLCEYLIMDFDVLEKLEELACKGIYIIIIMDRDIDYTRNKEIRERLEKYRNVTIVIDNIHAKTVIIDYNSNYPIVSYGNFNLTYSGLTSKFQYNSGIVWYGSKKIANIFIETFYEFLSPKLINKNKIIHD